TAAGLQRPSLTASPPAQVEPKAEVKLEETQTPVKIEQSQVTLKTEEAQASAKLEDTSPPVQIKAEETQAFKPAGPVANRRNEVTTEGVQKRRQQSSPKKKDGGKKKREKKKKKMSGRPPKPPATHPSTWRESRVPFFDTICATAAVKEYRVTQHDLLDLTYDEERSKNGPAY
ncbi:hypothetical protein EWM64_g10658, partial [Hericium alpestre]